MHRNDGLYDADRLSLFGLRHIFDLTMAHKWEETNRAFVELTRASL